VKFDTYASSEMKFVLYVQSTFHIAKQYFTAEGNFTRSKGTNFDEKSTCNRKCFFLELLARFAAVLPVAERKVSAGPYPLSRCPPDICIYMVQI